MLYEEAKKRPKTAALMACMYFGGLRRMEVVKLKSEECTDAADGTITLCFEGKGKKIREVPLGVDGSEAIRPYLGIARATSDWLFPGEKPGAHITTNTLYNRIKALAKAVELPDVSPHWFRHAYATHAGQAGCDPKTISEQMGHSSLVTTSRYMHANKANPASVFLDIKRASSVAQNASNAVVQTSEDTPPPPPPPRGSEWRRATTEDGEEYWWHRKTRETRWERPKEAR